MCQLYIGLNRYYICIVLYIGMNSFQDVSRRCIYYMLYNYDKLKLSSEFGFNNSLN